jgi:hypothetical protein
MAKDNPLTKIVDDLIVYKCTQSSAKHRKTIQHHTADTIEELFAPFTMISNSWQVTSWQVPIDNMQPMAS